MKKEWIDKLLEVARQTGREVEVAVSSVKDPHLRGIIAGVIMQRILQEVGSDEASASATVLPSTSSVSGSQIRKSGTQARILDLRVENFLQSLAAWSRSWRSSGFEDITTTNLTCG